VGYWQLAVAVVVDQDREGGREVLETQEARPLAGSHELQEQGLLFFGEFGNYCPEPLHLVNTLAIDDRVFHPIVHIYFACS
jgi:hypothetical protein